MTVYSCDLWHFFFYVIMKIMRYDVLIRLVLKQNTRKHDPQLTAKPDTHDDVNCSTSIISD
jgi:hypothetical protein